jgi:hypothetical protein
MLQMLHRRPEPGTHPPGKPAVWAKVLVTTALLTLAAATAAAVIHSGRADARAPLLQANVTLPADPPVSPGKLLVTLPWGDGPGQVGLQSPGEGLRRGPEALAVAPDGPIAVLDSVNRRVLLLSATGEPGLTISLDLAEPRFLAATETTTYVLDCDSSHRILGWDRGGGVVLDQELTFPSDPPVTALLVRDNEPYVELGHDRLYPVNALSSSARHGAPADDTLGQSLLLTASLTGRPCSASGRLVQARFTPAQGVRMSLFAPDGTPAVDAPSQISLATTRKFEYLVSVDPGGSGRTDGLLVGARLLSPAGKTGRTAAPKPSLLVARIPTDGSGRAAAAILLPESNFAYVGQPYTTGPDGNIYQPQASFEGYSIVVHDLDEGSTR